MVEQLLNELFRIRREERGVVGVRLGVRQQRAFDDGWNVCVAVEQHSF